MKITLPSHLTDIALAAEVVRLAGGEREGTVRLVAHLAEFDRRRLYLSASCSSLYAYCRSVLRLSEPEAYIRMKAARAVRRFPRILEMLVDGSLNLTTLRLLIPHLKSDNHESLLGAAAGKSKREAMELLARLFPHPEVPSSVRKLPAARAAVEIMVPVAVAQLNMPAAGAPPARPLTATATVPVTPSVTERPLSAPPPAPSSRHPLVTPLAPDRYRITFTASTETRDKLEFARNLLYYRLRHLEDVVREAAAPYGLSAPNSTGSGPSCGPDTQLVWTAWQDDIKLLHRPGPHGGGRRREIIADSHGPTPPLEEILASSGATAGPCRLRSRPPPPWPSGRVWAARSRGGAFRSPP